MVIKSDFYTFSIILLDVHVIRGQSQDRAFGEHARISLNLAHREIALAKFVEIKNIPNHLSKPKDVVSNFKQCKARRQPVGTTTDITGNLVDKDLTGKPIFFSGYGFTKLDK